MGSPCVKSMVMNVGNGMWMGQDKPSHFSNMGGNDVGGVMSKGEFTAALISQT